jgi:hypothetical protein
MLAVSAASAGLEAVEPTSPDLIDRGEFGYYIGWHGAPRLN